MVGADRLGRRVSAPVTELAAVAHRLRAGELDARAVPRGPVETVELGAALNRLADRIGELLTAEREAVADLSHRLRTPVTALRLDAGAVTEPELADRLRDHIGHLERTVDAVVKDARRPVRSTLGRSCDAASVVRDRVAFWSALAVDQGRDLTVSIPSIATPAAIDAGDLVDVVDALVDNVFAHTPDGTAFAVSLTRSRAIRLAGLEVADSGPGAANPDVTMPAATAPPTPPVWVWTSFAGPRSPPAETWWSPGPRPAACSRWSPWACPRAELSKRSSRQSSCSAPSAATGGAGRRTLVAGRLEEEPLA